jgi:3-oxoacyl-[acyl-carrier-protein] synthase-3
MDGRAIFNFMMTRVPENVAQCLERNGLEQDDIDLWVFHQASRYMLMTLAKRMKLDPDKVAIELDDVGNTTSSTIPIALARSALTMNPAPRNVLICGFGVGLSWASALLIREDA